MKRNPRPTPDPDISPVREQVQGVLPEITLIRSADLREKVLWVWAEALRRGGWAVEDLGRIPFTLPAKEVSVSILEHVQAVTRACAETARALRQVLGKAISLDEDTLLAGAILHDVGKLLEYKESGGAFSVSHIGKLLRHPVTGAALCCEIGLPAEVIHLVAGHAEEGEHLRRTPEGAILHHLDNLTYELVP